jgi:hypothetical protein
MNGPLTNTIVGEVLSVDLQTIIGKILSRVPTLDGGTGIDELRFDVYTNSYVSIADMMKELNKLGITRRLMDELDMSIAQWKFILAQDEDATTYLHLNIIRLADTLF